MALQLVRTDRAQRFDIPDGRPLVVGRLATCDVPLLDPTVSRRHAELCNEDDMLTLRDLGSSNGTWLNGERVERGEARAGDTVAFGDVKLEVCSGASRAAGIEPIVPAREYDAPDQQVVRRVLVPPPAAGVEPTGGGAHGGAAQRLDMLLEVAKGLSVLAGVDALLDRIASYLAVILRVDRVAILLRDETGELAPRIARDRYGALPTAPVPRSIAESVAAERVAVLTDNATEDIRFAGQSILAQRVRSAMCAPLLTGDGGARGVLYVDHLSASARFTEADLDFLVAFAGIAAAALERESLGERLRQEALVRSGFERFFAPALAARIAADPDAVRLGGERRMVAVLFSDIRGFTTLAERLSPEMIARQLTEYYTAMVDCVFRHGGTLDKFMGDAVLAQWGAPIGQPDDADRAIASALDMRTALDELNARWRREGRETLTIGIAISRGEVFAGYIGAERRLEYTVIGDAVNVAHRMCSVAKGGQILVTEALRESLRSAPELLPRGELDVRGKSEPVRVYEVAS